MIKEKEENKNNIDYLKKKKLLTLREASIVMGLGENKILELCAVGLPNIKNGRRTMIIQSKIDAFLDENIGIQI